MSCTDRLTARSGAEPGDRQLVNQGTQGNCMRKLTWTTALALSLAPALALAQANDLTVVFADDSTSDVTFDPRVTQSRHEEQVIVQVFDQLVAVDADGKRYPGLAKSWTMAPDNKSVTFCSCATT